MLTIIRDGKKKDIMVTLGTRPNQDELSNVYQYGSETYDILGLIVKNNLNNQNNSSNPKGIIVNAIKQNSPASENGIQIKDIIVVIGKNIITNIGYLQI